MCMKCSRTRTHRKLRATRAASTDRQQKQTIRHAPWPTRVNLRASARRETHAQEPRMTKKKSSSQVAFAPFREAFDARCHAIDARHRAFRTRDASSSTLFAPPRAPTRRDDRDASTRSGRAAKTHRRDNVADATKPGTKSRALRCSPEQIRTAVTALRGRRPRPLDDGAG